MTEILLADKLIEAAQSYRGPRILRDEYAYVAGKIKSAQRFVISPDVRGAICSLLTSRPSTLVAAARFVKLPFERCWVEWTPPDEQNIHPGQVPIRRCGAVLEACGPNGFTMFTAWEFERNALVDQIRKEEPELEVYLDQVPNFGFSAVVGAFDFSDFNKPPLMDRDPQRKWLHQRPLSRHDLEKESYGISPVKWALKDDKEWKAIQLLDGRSAFRVHEEVHGYERTRQQYESTGDVSSIVHDVKDEMGHIFATLILMNCKNGVEIAKIEPPEKLNKARCKRGKTELLPYSTVSIKLTKGQQRAVESGLITREEARRHPVRGHFKIRSSGVFWWSDFWRGNAARGTIERRAHNVET